MQTASRKVVVHLAVVAAAFQKLPLDEVVDAPLEVRIRKLESQLRHDLGYEQLVCQRLAHLHHTDNGSVDGMLPLLDDLWAWTTAKQ
jgi:hypothetical protein